MRAPTATSSATYGARSGLLERLTGRRRSAQGVRVVDGPATVRGERVMIQQHDADDRAVLATCHALYRQPPVGSTQDWQRWGWEDVHHADWAADRQALTLHALAGPARGRTVLYLPRGDRLAVFAAERVVAGRLLDTWVTLADGRVARVVARCRPGAVEPVWVVSLPGAVDDPRTDDMVSAAIAALRRGHGW